MYTDVVTPGLDLVSLTTNSLTISSTVDISGDLTRAPQTSTDNDITAVHQLNTNTVDGGHTTPFPEYVKNVTVNEELLERNVTIPSIITKIAGKMTAVNPLHIVTELYTVVNTTTDKLATVVDVSDKTKLTKAAGNMTAVNPLHIATELYTVENTTADKLTTVVDVSDKTELVLDSKQTVTKPTLPKKQTYQKNAVSTEVLPSSDSEVLPTSNIESLPTSKQEVLPSSDSEVLPTSNIESLPTSKQEVLPTTDPEVLPTSNIESLPTSKQEVLPTSDPEVLPTSNIESLPSPNQEVLPASDLLSMFPDQETSTLSKSLSEESPLDPFQAFTYSVEVTKEIKPIDNTLNDNVQIDTWNPLEVINNPQSKIVDIVETESNMSTSSRETTSTSQSSVSLSHMISSLRHVEGSKAKVESTESSLTAIENTITDTERVRNETVLDSSTVSTIDQLEIEESSDKSLLGKVLKVKNALVDSLTNKSLDKFRATPVSTNKLVKTVDHSKTLSTIELDTNTESVTSTNTVTPLTTLDVTSTPTPNLTSLTSVSSESPVTMVTSQPVVCQCNPEHASVFHLPSGFHIYPGIHL